MRLRNKGLLGILFSLALVLSLLPVSVFAEDEEVEETEEAVETVGEVIENETPEEVEEIVEVTGETEEEPGMSLTALAYDGNPYASLVNTTTTVAFNGKMWYIIADNSISATEGSVMLLAADNSFGSSSFAPSGNWSNAYSNSKIKTDLDAMVSTGVFRDVADAIVPVDLSDVSVTGAKLYLLDTNTAKGLPEYIRDCGFSDTGNGAWWLRSAGGNDTSAACMNGSKSIVEYGSTVNHVIGVRPALQLKLSKVVFSSINLIGGANAEPTPSGGSTVQNYFDYGTRSDMTTVTYKAATGYKFPAESAYYTKTNGITVAKTSDTEVTVSGKLDGAAAADITIPDAVSQSAYVWEGSGTDTDPYLISTEEDLRALATAVNGGSSFINTNFKLNADITLTDFWTPIGFSKRANYAAEAQAPYFAGTFDGNGKTITGLSNKVGDNTYTPDASSLKGDEYVYGLFGVVGNGAVIQNLTLSGVDIDTSRSANLKGDSVGAAVGYAFGTATVSGVTVSGSVTAVDAVGGIVGRCYQVDSNIQRTITITDCCADEMTVTATGAKAGGIAGFIGDSNKGHYTIIVTGNSFDGTVSSTTYNSPIAVFGAFMFTDNQGVATPNTSGNQTGNIYNIDENTTNTGKTKLKVASDGTVSMLNPHVHDLTYAAGEGSTSNTITAICSVDDCGLTDNKVTLTISAPTLTVYGQTGEGISEVATLTGLTEFNTASGKTIAITDIKYYKATKSGSDYIKGDALDAAPTDAGNYIAEITVSGVKTSEGEDKSVTAGVGYTISKANPEAAAVTANNRTYDGTKQPLVTVTGEAKGGTMQYALGTDATTAPTTGWGTSIPTGTEIGTYYVWYMVKGDENHIDSAPACVTVTIDKAAPTFTAPKAKTGLVENGKAQELITAGTATGGTMLYALGKDDKTAPDASAFKEAIPSGTNAGTYYVWYMVKGDADHSDSEAACVTVTIDKTGPTPTPTPAPTPSDKVQMYRLYNPNSGEHFYTSSKEEKEMLLKAGWTDEGDGFLAPVESKTPIYRLYNPNVGDHHYTSSTEERDMLVKAGWKDEGIGWYADDAEGMPMYRLYNPNAVTGTHHYTSSEEEQKHLISLGWKDEGIGFYACK